MSDFAIQAGIENAFSYAASVASQAVLDLEYQYMRPSVVYRPRLSIDGDMWTAVYGENIQDGVCGSGKSPADAMTDFDKAWATPLRSGAEAQEGNV